MTRARSLALCLFVLIASASGLTRALHLRVHHAEARGPVAAGEAQPAHSAGCGHRHACGRSSGQPSTPPPVDHDHGDDACAVCAFLASAGSPPSADLLLPGAAVDPRLRPWTAPASVPVASAVRLAGARAPPMAV